ncbi:Rv2629 family ribosome hibernation factor [Mycolicibacter algericus]|uniref:Peptide chain release factor 2 n=2 Tax=Mycolicibacter algericus TaxID=1288388 RepID=A0A7I9YBP1_MYCAL|nr:hypothetical protein [Mycolicibacter algericus]OQZ99649.1 hypothetical protein BST10_01485 [Mycolicibacter algericus DSM 45454]GFG86131.1 hypothetical protein MALGJ_28070 [Mycolicibacter algericus]
MDAERFRGLLTARAPFISVYFEDSHDTEDAATKLDLTWRAVCEQLTQQGADQQLVGEVERAVRELRPPVGKSGRAVIADADGVVLNEHLQAPAASTARLSRLPYLLPIIEHGFEYPNYVLAEVDQTGADITVHADGALRSETVDGGGYPVHKAAGADTPGYGDVQPHIEEAVRKNVRAVAARVTELADPPDLDAVFVVGEVQSRSALLEALPKRITALARELPVGARGHDAGDIQDAIEAECLRRQLENIQDAVQRFTAESGRLSGLAVEGLAAVCAGLSQGAVETLIIGDIGDATVVADTDLAVTAPDADVLSEYGAAPEYTLRADEALPWSAIAVGAAVVAAGGTIHPADGVAAVLRYPPTASA